MLWTSLSAGVQVHGLSITHHCGRVEIDASLKYILSRYYHRRDFDHRIPAFVMRATVDNRRFGTEVQWFAANALKMQLVKRRLRMYKTAHQVQCGRQNNDMSI